MLDTQISIYGIMLILGLISNIVIIACTYNKNNFTRDEIIGAIIYENMGIIFGAKVLAFFENYSFYNGVFDFWKLGLSSYGAVIGGFLFIMLFAFQFKKNLKEMIFTFIIPIPLVYAMRKNRMLLRWLLQWNRVHRDRTCYL